MIMIEESVLFWNNVEATCKLLNRHRNHKACEQIGYTVVLVVPRINAYRNDRIAKIKIENVT